MAPSRYDWKIVDWDVKPQYNQPIFLFCIYDNVTCKTKVGNKSSYDADTTFMVIQCLTHDSL